MKFSINQSEFLNALTTVAKGAATKSTLPILSGIYIKAQEESLTLEATDLDLSIRCTASALIEEEGETVIPSRLLTDVIKSLPNEAVHLDITDESATIICDTASFSIKVLPYQDFPGFPEITPEQTLTIPFDTFSYMVKKVAHVVSKDESRAVLTGIYIDVHDTALRMVATDSYRLAIADQQLEEEQEPFNAVISGSFLMDVAGMNRQADTVSLALSDNQIVISYGNTTFINRRIEGNYPRYNQLIPDSYTTRATFNTQQLIDATKRTSIMSNKTAAARFDINAASQTTQLSTAAQDIGAATETIASKVEGEDIEIAFNFGYVISGLTSIDSKEVYLELQGPMKPGILKSADDGSYLYLMMPVRCS